MSAFDDGQQMLAAVVRRRAGVVVAQLDGEMLLFHPERASLTVLDAAGTVVWALLDGTASVETLSAELADAYEAPVSTVQGDVLELVARLRADDLVDEVPAS